MAKKQLLLLLGLAVTLSAAGCGKKEDTAKTSPETEFSTGAPEEFAEEDLDTLDLLADDEFESEASLDPITPSDYLVDNLSDYITLGDLSGLSATEYTYEITDDMVDEQIQNELESYSEEIELDGPSESGNIVYADVTSSVQGDEDSTYTESTYFTIGAEDYGAEFDLQLTGVSSGDTLQFSITYDDDIWIDEWAGQTVDFDVTITGVYELSTPEYNDDFVSEYTEYDSVNDYEEAVREELSIEYENLGYSDAVEELFDSAMEQSVFAGYPDELYESCKEEVLSLYSTFAGTTDLDEICELFGITEEDIEAETLTSVNRRLLINAICEENNLEITEDEYVSYLEEFAEYYGYDSAVSFEEDYTRSALVWILYESKAADVLYQSATITTEVYEDEFEGEDLEFSEEDGESLADETEIPESDTEEFETSSQG